MMPSVICSVSRMRFPCDPHIDVATIIFFFVVLLLAATSRLLIGRLEKHFNFQPTKKEDALLSSSFLHSLLILFFNFIRHFIIAHSILTCYNHLRVLP
mgnify:CR=1 FL=1